MAAGGSRAASPGHGPIQVFSRVQCLCSRAASTGTISLAVGLPRGSSLRHLQGHPHGSAATIKPPHMTATQRRDTGNM